MINEWRIRKNLEEIYRGVIEVLPQYLPGGTEEGHVKPQTGCSDSDSKLAPVEYKLRDLPLHQAVS
jgi:hypothetical protein